MADPTLELRPVEEGDREFLLALYASTRADELAAVAWPPGMRQAFVRQQFEAQDRHYRQQYTGTSFQVMLVDGRPAGRLYLARWPEEIRVMDIALLPEHRGRGIGTRLLRDVLEEGAASGRHVSIHVEIFNPARRLYERLGFRPAADRGVYVMLEWRPPEEGEGCSID